MSAQPPAPTPDPLPPAALVAHVAGDVGAWPPAVPPLVVEDPRRAAPGWDGAVRPASGVVDPRGAAVVTVAPGTGTVAARDLDDLRARLPDLVGMTNGRTFLGVLRWTTQPADLDDVGAWLPVDDPRVPAWLRPFGGPALVALEKGRYAAGVGLKRHDDHVHEIAVVTAEEARGRGVARRLVAQAARHVLASGRVPTYLHAPDNEASARVARAAGFADTGWHVLGVFDAPPG